MKLNRDSDSSLVILSAIIIISVFWSILRAFFPILGVIAAQRYPITLVDNVWGLSILGLGLPIPWTIKKLRKPK